MWLPLLGSQPELGPEVMSNHTLCQYLMAGCLSIHISSTFLVSMSAVGLVRPVPVHNDLGSGHMIHYVNQYSTIKTMQEGESCPHAWR